MAGLKRQWQPVKGVPILAELLGGQREIGWHEALGIERCAAIEPAGGGVRSDEREQSSARLNRRPLGTIEMHGSERLISVESDDLRLGQERDVRVCIDPFDE